jgi:hypothetical protein
MKKFYCVRVKLICVRVFIQNEKIKKLIKSTIISLLIKITDFVLEYNFFVLEINIFINFFLKLFLERRFKRKFYQNF